MEYYRIPLYILFGIVPSLIWLFYYLRKDLHPEPKKVILRIFLLGCLVTIPVFFIQVGLSQLLGWLQTSTFLGAWPLVVSIIKWFFVIALTEETFKYLVVKVGILGSPVVDEPLDIMLYMVVAALGFAAVENILYLFSPINNTTFTAIIQTAIAISFIRFVGSTFLHTLCSALLGYFLALGSLRNKHGFKLTVLGIGLAVLLHGLYDFSIITLSYPLNLIVPVVIILCLVVFMVYDFNEIKKIKSICKI